MLYKLRMAKNHGGLMPGFILLFLFFVSPVFSQSEPGPFEGFLKNTKDSFTGSNTYLHLSAVAVTPLLIVTGVDGKVNEAFDEQNSNDIYRPGAIGGVLAPVLLGAPLFIHSQVKDDHETLRASYAVLHSTVITLGYVSLLKGLTGRPEPDNSKPESSQEQSEEFNFGFLKRGINYGWPSGHMATTMALASTMTHYYPEKIWVKWVGYGASAYMFGVVIAHHQSQYHWFSDAVAGALIGYAIGSTVGSNFRDAQNEEKAALMPILDKERSGIQVVWKY